MISKDQIIFYSIVYGFSEKGIFSINRK
ncbi:uncharacterized protein METZ01_LOCUS147254 [marine metagenome]|uniref:Uncharacterized protein n=1 Tax=marine metagenome TaxID=408172 RepID=A0A381ZYV3_9ZZZZ